MNEFGRRLKELREREGLTQEQLADMCGFPTQSRIGNYERGKRTPRQADLKKLATALKLDIAELLRSSSTDEAVEQEIDGYLLPAVLRSLVSALVANIPAVGRDFAVLFERQAKQSGIPADVDLAVDLLSIVDRGQSNAAAAVARALRQSSGRRAK